jgi:hypothetical protein
MMKKIMMILCLMSMVLVAQAQGEATFSVSVTMDSILLGNKFRVTFTLENGAGEDFQPPAFPDFQVWSGPNMSSSYSMINGTVSQSVSYTFLLEPKDIGNYYIEPASVKVGGDILETMPIEVMVVPNPEGIIQKEESAQSNPFGNFELRFDNMIPEEWMRAPTPRRDTLPSKPQKKKKKRKIYKL